MECTTMPISAGNIAIIQDLFRMGGGGGGIPPLVSITGQQ